MSFEAGRPTRPVAVMPTFTDALATGTMPGQQQSSTAIQADFQSASTPVKPQQAPATYPEIATFSEINQLFPGATLMARQQQMLRCVETANRGRLEGGDAMVYACRHPAAEQNAAPGSTTGEQAYCTSTNLCPLMSSCPTARLDSLQVTKLGIDVEYSPRLPGAVSLGAATSHWHMHAGWA